MLSLVFVLLFAGSLAQTSYDVVQYYLDPSCVNNYVLLTVDTNSGVADTCQGNGCQNIEGSSSTYYITTCGTTTIPSGPGNAITSTTYSASTTCQGTISSMFAYTSGACVSQESGTTGTSFVFTCAGGLSYDAADCTGNQTITTGFDGFTGSLGCFVDNDGISSTSFSCPKCFHKDSKIVYAGQTQTVADFQKGHPSCVVPHTFNAAGFKITTSCEGTLRVTGEHLVFTQNGLVQAQTIKVGDFLFGDHEEKKTCEVRSVEVEQGEYFALNCEESVVLADGYKTSTFGLTHDLPALWMKVASKVVGIETASAWGDVLSSIFSGLF